MISTLLKLAFVETAYAVNPCAGLSGCNAGSNQIAEALPTIGAMLIAFGAGLSVLFVVVGGAQMLISAGNEGTAGKGKTTVIFALVGYAITLASQPLISFIFNRSLVLDVNDVNDAPFWIMAQIVDIMLSLFNVAFVIVSIVAGFRMVLGGGQSSEFEAGKKIIQWAIAGGVVVNLAYVLVQATRNLGF